MKNLYNIRIDGQIAPKSYQYEELEEMGVFGFDDIEVKRVGDTTWTDISLFRFPECNSYSYTYVDEYGQVHRNGNDSGSSSSTESSNSHNKVMTKVLVIFFRILGTIAVLGGAVAICCAVDDLSSVWRVLIVVGCSGIIRAIWSI